MSTPRILHLLPHRGGGGDIYVGLLERLDGYAHDREYLSRHVRATAALPSLVTGWPRAARAARQADLVHVHGDTGTLLALPFVRGRAWVWTTHGLHMLRRSEGVRRRLVQAGLRRAIKSSAMTVCTSAAERDELSALGLVRASADRVTDVPVGIPFTPPGPDVRGAVRAELGVDDSTTLYAFVGTLEPRKAPLLAAQAAIEARDAGAPVVLLVVGDGPLRGELEALAGEAVRPLGFRDDVDRLMAASDAFVLPSTREGLPLALLEAMSHGLVPIVADDPGSREAVGDAGIAVPAGDVSALARAIAELAENRGERDRLAVAARERYGERFRLDRFLAAMDAVYGEALSL